MMVLSVALKARIIIMAPPKANAVAADRGGGFRRAPPEPAAPCKDPFELTASVAQKLQDVESFASHVTSQPTFEAPQKYTPSAAQELQDVKLFVSRFTSQPNPPVALRDLAFHMEQIARSLKEDLGLSSNRGLEPLDLYKRSTFKRGQGPPFLPFPLPPSHSAISSLHALHTIAASLLPTAASLLPPTDGAAAAAGAEANVPAARAEAGGAAATGEMAAGEARAVVNAQTVDVLLSCLHSTASQNAVSGRVSGWLLDWTVPHGRQ
ncbi:unnamed protein product [Closterium sp. NIES-53]